MSSDDDSEKASEERKHKLRKAGVAVGIGVSLMSGRLVQSVVFGVSPSELPWTSRSGNPRGCTPCPSHDSDTVASSHWRLADALARKYFLNG